MGRKGKNTSFEIRQLVIYHKEKGTSYREIAKLLNVSKSPVADIVHRYIHEDRIDSIRQKGRPKLLDSREERKIVRRIKILKEVL